MIRKNLPNTYTLTLQILKERIHQAQYTALKAVNKELIKLYWDIGRTIVDKQVQDGWGKSTVEQLSRDLQVEFTGMSGFSPLNLWRMKRFYETYHINEKLSQLVKEIGWSHNIVIFEKVKNEKEKEFYITACIGEGWSRHSLERAIHHKEYEKWKNQQTNFQSFIDQNFAEKAERLLKDEYNLDFLYLEKDHKERELEDGLTTNIVKFLAEMGGEFCFVGRQYRVEVSDNEYFIDLLFFHRGMKSLIAIELKAEKFQPEFLGKMGFYLAVLDKTVRKPDENPSIGIIICRTKDRTVVEYALSSNKSPIGVATYSYNELPYIIARHLPSERDFTQRLGKVMGQVSK